MLRSKTCFVRLSRFCPVLRESSSPTHFGSLRTYSVSTRSPGSNPAALRCLSSRVFASKQLRTCPASIYFQSRNLSAQPVSSVASANLEGSNQLKENSQNLVESNVDGAPSPELDLSNFFVATPELLETAATATAKTVGITSGLPPSFIFEGLQFLHNYFPWWGSIALATLCIRLAVFPLLIRGQRLSGKLADILPEMQKLQVDMQKAQENNDLAGFEVASMKLQKTMQENNFNIMRFFVVPMANGVVFTSFFFALRAMAYHPMEGMKDEGLFWFVDLTSSDPLFLLPLATSATLFVVMKMGIEFGTMPDQAKMFRWLTYIFPPVCFITMSNFPSALCVYWLTNNLISFVQSILLRNNSVRRSLDLKIIKKVDNTELEKIIKDPNFKAGVGRAWDSMVMAQKMQEKAELGKKLQPLKATKK